MDRTVSCKASQEASEQSGPLRPECAAKAIHNLVLNSEDSVSSTSSTTAADVLCFKEIQELGGKASLSELVTGYAAGHE